MKKINLFMPLRTLVFLVMLSPIFLRAQTNTFPSSGPVGIGTTTPTALLDLGSSTVGLKQLIYGSGTNGNTGYYMGFGVNLGQAPNTLTTFIGPPGGDGTHGDGSFSVASATSAWPYTSYLTRFTVLSSGDVGIGTVNPNGYKLAVQGNIHAQEVNVDITNWPDYVFAERYKLLPLHDLEKYLLANKHLPNMPSAKEIASKGQNLGEINSKLLKNVEELTLHLIEKDKEIQKQQAQLNAQHTDIEKLKYQMKLLLHHNKGSNQ